MTIEKNAFSQDLRSLRDVSGEALGYDAGNHGGWTVERLQSFILSLRIVANTIERKSIGIFNKEGKK